MARIPRDTIDRIRDRADILDVVSDYEGVFFIGKPPLFPLLAKEGCRGGLNFPDLSCVSMEGMKRWSVLTNPSRPIDVGREGKNISVRLPTDLRLN